MSTLSFNEFLAHPAVKIIKNDNPDFNSLITRNELLAIYSGINRNKVSSDVASVFTNILTTKRTNPAQILKRITEQKRVSKTNNTLLDTGIYAYYYDDSTASIVEGSLNPGSPDIINVNDNKCIIL